LSRIAAAILPVALMPSAAAPAGLTHPAWTFRTGAVVTARPAVAGGRVYVGDWAGRIVALRLADGRPIWRFQARRSRFVYAGQIVGSPAVAEGTVYVGAGDTVYALGSADGRLR
jgi:polyvinyl alcohol dehydrogenase (cytochrome)